MQYEDLIGRLKKRRPGPAEPARQTNRIMNSILKSDRERNVIFSKYVNPAKWSYINAVRVVMTAAASFLIIFFIIEQRGIDAKLRNLEATVAQSKNQDTRYLNQQVKYQEIFSEVRTSLQSDSLDEILQINRRTLNYFLSRIRELEAENLSIRDKLSHYYDDSINLK